VRRSAPFIALLAGLALATAGSASASSSGGASAPTGGAQPTTDGGGAPYGRTAEPERRPAAPKPKRVKKPKGRKRTRRPVRGRGPVLTRFKLVRPHLFLFGRPAKVSFRIEGHTTRMARVRLYLKPAGRRRGSYTVSLASWRTGQNVTVPITGHERGRLRDGSYVLRISARDTRGTRLRRAPGASSTADLTFRGHRFPLTGSSWSFGGSGGRFGSPRAGHTHQGQDLPAPQGTPIVAPRGGTVKTVAYQAGGAGYYVVLHGRGEDRDYVFMHLRSGSTRVHVGQRVRTGQRLGDVGATGDAQGAHLHFEVWVGGGWFSGGHAVDPLPYLRAWAR
jgi:murein DD-endopeptidase MepM/ murein hydrolase activator NlpD